MRDKWQLDWLGAGGDDGVFECDFDRPVFAFDGDGVGAGKFSVPVDDAAFAELGHAAEALGQLADDFFLPRTNLGQIDLRFAKLDAVRGKGAGILDDLGHVKQSLGWYAAHVEADAAETGKTFDDYGVQPEISRAKGSGIAGRAGAEHDDLCLDRIAHQACNSSLTASSASLSALRKRTPSAPSMTR